MAGLPLQYRGHRLRKPRASIDSLCLGDEEVHDFAVMRVQGGEDKDLAAFCPYFRLVDDEQASFMFSKEFPLQFPSEALEPAPDGNMIHLESQVEQERSRLLRLDP